MATESIREMVSFAVDLAKEAGEMTLAAPGDVAVSYKADASPVTETDLAVQRHIIGAIAKRYPGHAVRAEEATQAAGEMPDAQRARYCWVIDPIDGTRNFASGLPCFATSIAVLDEGRPVVGVVYEHNLRSCFSASAGCGATLNGTEIHVAGVATSKDILVGSPSSKGRITIRVLGDWIARPGLVLRNFGSTALHLAMVASGSLGATFSKQCKIWDIAAGVVLVKEAGGKITDLDGRDRTVLDLSLDPDEDLPVLAAEADVHQRLFESICKVLRNQ